LNAKKPKKPVSAKSKKLEAREEQELMMKPHSESKD
jgi:hypothetical protein